MPTLSAQDYRVGWVCALNMEMAVAIGMLDEEYEMIPGQDLQDHNSYVLGRIHQHNVVIACMPEGVDGLVPAANLAKDMARTFPMLRIGLMVGIGGGVPNLLKGIDIRLGDIVVSKPEKTWGGVVQYDKGKAEDGGKFVVKGQLNQPPILLLQTLSQVRARHKIRPSKVEHYIKTAIERNPLMVESGFTFPITSDCFHCNFCDRDVESPAADCEGFHTKRKQRSNNNPVIHYGTIASGNQVVKDAAVRDRLRDQFEALCVEMEAAGLMNDFPCLVVRGICDYADKHKRDEWHPHAAMTAAAYAKELLLYISPAQAIQEKPLDQLIDSIEGLHQTAKEQVVINQSHLEATEAQTQQKELHYESDRQRKCHQTFKVGPYEDQKNINPDRVVDTCKWVLDHPQYCAWYGNAHDDLLWISADPGCGKSVLAKSLIDNELQSTDNHTVCYFFFKDTGEQDNLSTALCAILHQLFAHRPRLIPYAIDAYDKSGDKLNKDTWELWRIFLDAARDSEAENVTCVLDALDECQEDDRCRLIQMLVAFYHEIPFASERRGRLKFLVTSRPYDDIQYHFGKISENLPQIRLRGEDENDNLHVEIDLVVRAKVSELATEFHLTHNAIKRLETKLLSMEHRTYLWLYLAVGNIRETYRDSLQPNQVTFDSLPASVDAAYEKILNKVKESVRAKVMQILEIIVGARRPLTTGEIALALGTALSPKPTVLADIDIDTDHLNEQIRVWCGLFVFINHSRIYLIHQTAKEFLLRPSNSKTFEVGGWKHCLRSIEVEKSMTRICTRFLLLDDVAGPGHELYVKWIEDEYGNKKIKFQGAIGAFTAYSAEHWPSHARDAEWSKTTNSLVKSHHGITSTASLLSIGFQYSGI